MKIATPSGSVNQAEDLEAEQHGEAAGHELDEHVAGEDVREQPDGQRDQPQEVREQLQREDHDQDRPRSTPGGIRLFV